MFLQLSSEELVMTRANRHLCSCLLIWLRTALLTVIVFGLGCGSRVERTYYCGPNKKTYTTQQECLNECKVSLAHFVGICVATATTAKQHRTPRKITPQQLLLAGLLAAALAAVFVASVALPLLGPGIWAWLGSGSVEAMATAGVAADVAGEALAEATVSTETLAETDLAVESSAESAAENTTIDEMIDAIQAGRNDRLREEAREIAMRNVAEELQSGVRSPATEMLERDIGRDTAVDLAEGEINMEEAGVEAHHSTSVSEAPEWGTAEENIEPLSEQAHRQGAHRNSFAEDSSGRGPDPNFEENLGFRGDRQQGVPSIDQSLENTMNEQAVRDFAEAEEQLIDFLDGE